MAKLTAQKLTKELKRRGFPANLIPGITVAFVLGATGLVSAKNYYQNKQLFPDSGYVQTVEDGDTLTLKNGRIVRLVGVNTPERGQRNFEIAKATLTSMVSNKKIYLEYDRYQDDKFARVLAWVWVDCEITPKFLPADYMHKNGNESNPGLKDNPQGCKKGKLVNEELIKKKLAVPVVYKDRGEFKYEARIFSLFSKSP